MNKLISEESLFKGPRFEIIRKIYQREDGIKYLRDIVNPGNAVMILAVDSYKNVTFIKQFREAANRMNLELPAGMIDEGETPEEAARRELEEETGLRANKMTLLKEVFTSSGYSSEKIYIFSMRKGNRIHCDVRTSPPIRRSGPAGSRPMPKLTKYARIPRKSAGGCDILQGC